MEQDLMAAVLSNDSAMVTSLLTANPSPHQTSRRNALRVTVENNNADMLRVLLVHCKADTQRVTFKHESVLHVASKLNNLHMMVQIMQHVPLQPAQETHETHETQSKSTAHKTQITKHQSAHQPFCLEARDRMGRTPLQVAVKHNKVEAVELLLASKANVEACKNTTVLHLTKSATMTGVLLQALQHKRLAGVKLCKLFLHVEMSCRVELKFDCCDALCADYVLLC
jgi:ankyrin repeat protein